MTGTALTISNAGGYLDLELHGGGWIHDKAFTAGDLICQSEGILVFEYLPGKLQCVDTCFLSPEVYKKWIAGKIRLWGGIRTFWSEPDIRPIVSAEIVQKAIESQQDIQVSIKREKWFKSVYKLRKPSRHYRISRVELVGRDDTSS